jgi:hypothetical protein
MDNKNKNKIIDWAIVLLVSLDYFFLSRLWALVVLLIACVPVRDNWHIYCLAIGVPILLISIVWSLLWVVRKEDECSYCDTDIEEEDVKSESHE